MTKKIQMMSHDKEWQIVNGVETLVPVEQIDIDPITDSSAVQIEGHRTLEETLATKHQMTPEIDETKIMSKVGGVYHQNVVDGAYEEAILYGNSKVNLMEDDTTTAQSIPLTFTSFNNGLQKELALGTNTVAPMLKGATLINRALTNSVSLASGEKFYIHNLKGNTVHTVSFKFTTKNTNAGVVIESCTGETYLENSMHKTGLGDSVIFTVTTHANADSIAIVNNAAYGGETIKLDDIMVIEGDQTLMDLTFFKGMRSVELVKPLTNLFRDNLGVKTNNTTVTNTGGTVTVTSSSSVAWSSVNYYLSTSLKQHTKYLVMWDSITKTHTSTANPEALISVYDSSDNTRLGYINNSSLCPTQRSLIFDTGDKILSNIVIRIHATQANTETGTTTVKGLRVFEWDDATSRALDLQSIGYFSGTKNVSIPNFKTNSKNLYPFGDVNFTSAGSMWYDAKGNINMYGDIASKSQSRFLLRKGTYTLSIGSTENIEQYGLVDDKEGTYSNTFTLQQDTYMTLRFKRINANTLTTATNIQIERGTSATDYVAYDTRQYKPDNQEVVVLRSLPNGVCDTFNLQTGEYVQNIGETILNGSEEWYKNGNFTNMFRAYCLRTTYLPNARGNQGGIADTFPTYNYSDNNVNSDDIKGLIHAINELYIKVPKSDLPSEDIDGLKQWLSDNPIKVQYELKTPVIKQIPIINNVYTASNKVNFKESKNADFRCFGNPTYLEVGSLSPVNPIVQPITNIPLNVRLKANTSYTVRLDRTGSSLNVDLGGTTVSTSNSTDNEFIIKTPTGMLSHNQIRFSGNGSVGRVMVFEGDVRGIELPYFMGINNVKMPIVRNTGKNLFDVNANGFELGYIDGNGLVSLQNRSNNFIKLNNGFSVKVDNMYGGVVSPFIKVKPNTSYKFSYEMLGSFPSQNNFIFYDANKKVISGLGEKSLGYNFTTPNSCAYFRVGFWLFNPGTIQYKNIQLEEGSTTTSFEPYRGNDICLVQGEIGLSQDMFESGGYGAGNGGTTYEDMKYAENSRTRIKTYLRVKPNTTYRLTYDGKTNFNHREYDIDGVTNGVFSTFDTNEKVFTTQSTTEYITMLIECAYSSFKPEYLQLLELDSTVQLRSLPNGVKDELNLLTGEYIQRVGEVVFDGSEDEGWHMEDVNVVNHLCFDTVYAGVLETNPLYTNFRISDKFDSISHEEYLSDSVEGIRYFSIPAISISRSKLNEPNVTGFKQYLQQNPITVQYELAEPIISYPRIVSNTQEREVGVKLPNGVCDTYNPSTGITVKRVGKMILDGSENWVTHEANNGVNTVVFYLDNCFNDFNTNILCNDFQECPSNINFWQSSVNDKENYLNNTSSVGIRINKNRLNSVDVNGFKAWLQSNPITIWYELKNPIVTTDIVLPNGVHDEYNPLTGLYTKRVGFIEFDGSDDENWSLGVPATGTDVNQLFLSPCPQAQIISKKENCNIICDKLPYLYELWNTDQEGVHIFSNPTRIAIRVTKSKLTEVSLVGLKQYLSQNPLRVWYELATPITYQLTPYFGLPMPYAYKDGYLIMDSAYDGQTLPPEIKYKLLANRTGQITQNNIKLQNHTSKLSNLEAMLVEATLQSMYEREMMAFNLEMVNINLINLEE